MSVTEAPPEGVVRVELGALAELRVELVHAPYLSVLALMKEVLANSPRGLPTSVARRIDLAVSAPARSAVDPLADPHITMAPLCLYPGNGLMPRLTDSVTAMRDASSGFILSSIAEDFGEDVPEVWRRPLKAPRPWLSGFTQAVVEVARETAKDRHRSHDAVATEIARGQLAIATGTLDVFLQTLGSRLTLDGTALIFDDPMPEQITLGGRRLVLAPIYAGSRILTSGFDHTDFVWIGYPVPGLFSASTGAVTTDLLMELLGPTRAALLLCVGRSRSVGDLAAFLNISLASVTFHCDRLVATGLVQRQRSGRQVHISRTARGDELIDVMT